jgi:tRNA nucleotidyltransferase (CCA-adding enzyme)
VEIYLVGGAVRDGLLGRPVHERDWVVVGATADELLAKGFRAVGKDFPVFLHPSSQEEYALARIERKVAPGYAGFEFHATPTVTLEEDLQRRDLTINAMAQANDGRLIDPYQGQSDLQKRLLRHVSPAFVEDPVRILRVARFAARYHAAGFSVAPETMVLMQQMVLQGEVDALTAERVWQELQRALAGEDPQVFFLVLEQCGALAKLFPSLMGDSGALAHLTQIATRHTDPIIRFAVLFAANPLDSSGIQALAKRYCIPKAYVQLTILAKKYLYAASHAQQLSATELLNVLHGLDSFRQPARLIKVLAVLAELTDKTASQTTDYIKQALQLVSTIDVQPLIQGLHGKAIADALFVARRDLLATQLKIKQE